MEGESDRRRGYDSPERATDGRYDYTEARDSESRKAEKGRERSNAGKLPRQEDGARATEIKDDTAEAARRFDHVNSSLNGKGRSELGAEPESRSDLEELREDLREKYPQIDESRGSEPEGRAVPDAADKSEVGRKFDPSTAEDTRLELDRHREDSRGKQDELGRAEPIPMTGRGATRVSLDKVAGDDGRRRTTISDSGIRESGAKIDSPQRESAIAVPSDRLTREVESAHEKSVDIGHSPSTKSNEELADLERSAVNIENWRLVRQESDTRTPPGISGRESSQQENMDNGNEIPVNARLHQSKPLVITFDIPRRDIEEKTGVKIEDGKLYRIKGDVGGKYDFEMYRTVDSYVRHSVPVEHHHQIQGGNTYDIRISGIEEVPLTKAQSELVSEWKKRGVPWNRIAYRINHMQPEQAEALIRTAKDSGEDGRKKLHQLEKLERVDKIGATFVAVSRLHGKDKINREDRFYFRINNAEYKQKTGMAIEEGATYKVTGEIEGVGQFEKKLRSVAAGQNMPIYVPRELNSKVELGTPYKITIDSVERIPSVRDSWEKLERPSNEWSWKEIASWIDTEGRINTESGYYADIAQKDKRVIQEICGFYDQRGLHPMMILDKSMGGWHAHLHRVDDVATVVKNVEQYIRTENKKEQILKFKESLMEPRKRLRGGIRKARKLLDLE